MEKVCTQKSTVKWKRFSYFLKKGGEFAQGPQGTKSIAQAQKLVRYNVMGLDWDCLWCFLDFSLFFYPCSPIVLSLIETLPKIVKIHPSRPDSLFQKFVYFLKHVLARNLCIFGVMHKSNLIYFNYLFIFELYSGWYIQIQSIASNYYSIPLIMNVFHYVY